MRTKYVLKIYTARVTGNKQIILCVLINKFGHDAKFSLKINYSFVMNICRYILKCILTGKERVGRTFVFALINRNLKELTNHRTYRH